MTWLQGDNTAICSPGSCSSAMLTFLSLLTQYMSYSYDDKFKLTNFDDGSNQFDFIVVGAGGAGCVVANRLTENENWRVLLLEGGDEEPIVADVPGLLTLLKSSSHDYGYKTQPEPNTCANKPCHWTRGKTMGGCSTVYSTHFVRGNRWDYDNWATLGNLGWNWNNVLPYFKKSEDCRIPEVLQSHPYFHSTGGYQTIEGAKFYDDNAKVIMKGWKEIGLREVDYNSGNNLGTSRMQYAMIQGARQSSNGAFIRPIRGKRRNLIIRTKSRVTKIIIDAQTKQTTGVEYITEGTNEIKKAYASKEVIISAGSLDSPKLLMLSGIGPADTLKESGINIIKELPVGKILRNHFSITPISVSVRNKTAPFSIEMLQNDVIYWLSTHSGPMSVNPFMDNIAFLKTSFEKQPNVPDIQVGYIKFKYDESIESDRFLLPYYDGFLLTTLYLAPKSHGYLKLNSTDPINSQPLMYPNFFSHPDDIKAITEGARLTKQLVETNAFKEAGFIAKRAYAPLCDHLEYETDNYYECLAKNHTGVINHMVSTCKMGPEDDPEAVVDPTLKVIGIKGLRVIDASIMPVLTRGNTHAPTVMIGEKGSDLIKKDWS